VKYTLFIITVLCMGSSDTCGQEDEKTGFPLLYEEDFERQETIGGFVFSDPAPWFLTSGNDGGFALEYAGRGDYQPRVRSPRVIGLIDQLVLGEFVLEADVLQTSREYGHREMCIFFGFQDSTRFYYAQLATMANQMAHNVNIVNDMPAKGIATERTDGVIWGDDQWHHIRLERYLDDGSIRVYFDDMGTPVLVANDKTFQFGYVGFGSFGNPGKVDNIRIWAGKWRKKKSDIFIKNYYF
jgi:hypothetical protein